uniref:Uncharacterized protein n=1 Tax=uncultured bacterium A1Q1_fos_2286 TaxID=1256566 RepID=L7VYV1_9BACT|nr:hypothetical protein [uncultured bacterium A1Q1_fos_2286]
MTASITLTDTAGTMTNVLERTVQNALDLARSADSPFRRHDDVAVAMPGGMFGHVHKGKLVSFGLEPMGDVLVDSQRKVSDLLDGDKGKVLWGRVAAVAGGAAAAASSIAGVATAVALGRRRHAA